MAKKADTEYTEEINSQEIAVAQAPAKVPTAKKDEWVIKDRLYELQKNVSPIVFTIPTSHTSTRPLLWFDPEKGYQRELRYATNQKSCFVDEQEGQIVMGRIVLRDGALRVPAEQVVLQKLLSLYHPFVKEGIIAEYKPQEAANHEIDWIEFELAALNLAKSLSIDEIEGILRVEMGEKVNTLSSTELKRDILVFARNNPALFLQLAEDENTQLRNFAIKAVEANILRLSQDQRTFTYGDTNRKVMTVPFDEHPYSALAAFFKTDEGMEVYKAIEKRLK
jgi:hypothetical protein